MDYKDIFNKRGEAYHNAMTRFPHVREEEFINALSLVSPCQGRLMLDAPSGGCYLCTQYKQILKDVKIVNLEVSKEFARLCPEDIPIVLADSLDSMPFKSSCFDLFFSLAGVHHIRERGAFYLEAYRILKKGGTFLLGDVLERTPVSLFLNEFVNNYNSMGHVGFFIDQQDIYKILDAGFEIVFFGLKHYYWKFRCVEEMVEFCRLLFGMDRGKDSDIIKGLEEYVGFLEEDNCVKLNWHLFFIKAVKPY